MLEQDTFAAYNTRWANSHHQKQTTADLLTIYFETHREVDSYFYQVGKDDLIAPQTGEPIRQFIDTSTPVGKREGAVYEQLFSWSKKAESGVAVWVSPPTGERSQAMKVILHEVVGKGREKFILNRVILDDKTSHQAVDLANRFSAHSTNSRALYTDPEKVRAQLFTMQEGMGVVDLLKLFVEDQNLIEQVQTGEDLLVREKLMEEAQRYSDKIHAGVSAATVYQSMASDGFIGEHDMTCPPSEGQTFSEYTASNAIVLGEAKFVRNCGHCGVAIGARISAGYRCKSCRQVYRGC